MGRPRIVASGVMRGRQGAQGLPAVGSAAWQAEHFYALGSIIQAPDGSWLTVIEEHTSGATFDETELAYWTPVAAKEDTLTRGALEEIFLGSDYGDEVNTGRLSEANLSFRFSEPSVFIGASQMQVATPATGTLPTFQAIGGLVGSWRLDANAEESVTFACRVPQSWKTFEAVVYGANWSTDTGDVCIRVLHLERGVLASLSGTADPAHSSNSIVAALGQYVRQGISIFPTGIPNDGDLHVFRILRVAADAADTKVGDYGIVGIDLYPKTFHIPEPRIEEDPGVWPTGRTFTAEHNALIPEGMLVIQHSAPPDTDDDSAGTFKLWPANTFLTIQDFSDSLWTGGERWDYRWCNRQNYLPGQTNSKPNFLWGAAFRTSAENGDYEVRTTFSSVALANAATHAQIRHMLDFTAQEVEDVWTAAGGDPADIITEAYAKANIDTVFTELHETVSGYIGPTGSRFNMVARDTVILPTNKLIGIGVQHPELNTTVVLDYEVADERSEAETTAFVTAVAADVHSVGRKIMLFTNPLTSGIMRHHGLGANLESLLGIVDYMSLMIASNNPEASAQESYLAGLNALGGSLTTAEYQKLIITFGIGDRITQMPLAAAQYVHELLTGVGDDHPIGVVFWRYHGKFGGGPERDYNKRVSTVVFGTATPPAVP